MIETVNILLVDDDPRNLDALEAILDDPGYRLLRADEADKALRLLLDHDVAAIILDIKMPGLSGFELAQLIKGTKKFREIPIVFLTARAEFRDRARGLDIGGVDYITKPFNPVELAPLVRSLLGRLERGERDELRREKIADLRALMGAE